MFFWRILRTLGSLIGVSGGKALFQFLLNWDQFPTAASLSEVLILITILIIIINRYCHHTASCVDQVLGQRTVESIPAFLDCFPPPTSQCMCSKVSDSNIINMANKQNINSTKKNIVATTTKWQKTKPKNTNKTKIPKTEGEQLQLQGKKTTTTSTRTKKNNLGEEPSQLYGSSLALADLALPFSSLVLLLRLHFTYFYIFQEASIASPSSVNFLRIQNGKVNV